MIKINIVCVGNLKDKEYITLVEEYKKRISRFAKINISELKEKTEFSNHLQVIECESEDILNHIDTSTSILCDVKGDIISSEQFAQIFENWFNAKSEITFVIGGSYGFSEKLKSKITKKISFGKMTFPHRLARVMLLEQIYRALTIINNVTYHK